LQQRSINELLISIAYSIFLSPSIHNSDHDLLIGQLYVALEWHAGLVPRLMACRKFIDAYTVGRYNSTLQENILHLTNVRKLLFDSKKSFNFKINRFMCFQKINTSLIISLSIHINYNEIVKDLA